MRSLRSLLTLVAAAVFIATFPTPSTHGRDVRYVGDGGEDTLKRFDATTGLPLDPTEAPFVSVRFVGCQGTGIDPAAAGCRPHSSVCCRAMSDVSRILSQIDQGDPRAAEQLLPLVYDELRKLAAARLAQEKPGQTLQPTALVHEAYLRLMPNGVQESGVASQESGKWNSRGHFFAAAAEAMRRILIESARRKRQTKHGGELHRVILGAVEVADERKSDHLLALDEALVRLETHDNLAARIVKLRYFAGLSMPEIAEVLGISLRTVERNWTYARTWLHRELA